MRPLLPCPRSFPSLSHLRFLFPPAIFALFLSCALPLFLFPPRPLFAHPHSFRSRFNPLYFFCFVPPHLFPFFPPRIPRPSHTPSLPSPRSFPALSSRLPPSDFILYYKFFLSFRSLLACLFFIVFIRNFYKIAQQRTLGCSKSQKTRTENTKLQTIHRQATFPPRQAKTSAKKANNGNAKKTKTEKQKRKRKNPERIRPQVAKQTYAPISPYKNGRRGDRTATAESTESGRQKQNPGRTKKRNVPKSKAQKTSAYGTQSPVKFSAGRGMCRHTGYKDHAGRTDVRAIQAKRAARAMKPAHATRNTKPEQTTRVSRTTPRPYEPRGKIPEVFCREGGIFH